MYQVGEFNINSTVGPVPILWIFEENGVTKCFWPVYDLKKNLLKKTPPPATKKENRNWMIFEVNILLRKSMYFPSKTIFKIFFSAN